MDPLRALADIIVGWHKISKLNDWIRLCFQIACSMLGSFLFVTGTALVSSKSWPVSVGSGMITSAVVLVAFLRRSPLTRGMIFTFPTQEASVEINTDLQTLSK